MITLCNVTLRRGPRVLLKQINWTIYHKQRIGIIGENGCGKSTLFSLLRGEFEQDEGDLNMPSQLKLAYVEQETPHDDSSALDYVLNGDVELRLLQAELARAESNHNGGQIAHIHDKLFSIDAYSATARAGQLLDGLGFSFEEQQQSVSDFSGGWRVRLNLAKALMSRSDILLLDEPTNHLDLDAVLWLEAWLAKYQGTLLIISHDRDFLDKVVDHIAFISHEQLKLYTGNYSSFEKQRAEQLLLQQSAFEKQQKKIAHMQSFVDRFKAKATKARQAQSRLKAIEKMELICAVQTESPFQFEFKEPTAAPNPLITLEKASIAYQEKTILNHIQFSIAPKDRIAILGPNGAGKSSLIKLLAGEIHPTQGQRFIHSNSKIGYFAQHQVDKLTLTDSAIEHLRDLAPTSTDLELRKFLGSFGFIGDRVFEAVKNFSGGEKSRLALALLVWQKPNLLLLDEPTNHLDLDMRQALSLALQSYEGAMILVSHDRFLLRSTTDQFWLVANGQVTEYDGDLNDYQQWLINYRKIQSTKNLLKDDKEELSKKEQRQQSAKQRELMKPLLQKIQRMEKELEKLQAQLSAIEISLADTALYEGPQKEKLRQMLFDQAQLKKEIERVEHDWLMACEERDKL